MVSTKFSSNVSDPVSDLLTRIRNANIALQGRARGCRSRSCRRPILEILSNEGYIERYERGGEGVHQAFVVRLKYGPRKQKTITGLRRISKPGRRVYRGRDELPARDGRPRGRDRVARPRA